MAKNLVLCLDGTGAQPKAAGNTNVVRLYSMLDLADPEAQIAYYDPGVGTVAAAGAWTPLARWWSRVAGLAFGSGIKQNLGEAYTWLMHNWEPGDRIFVFGFSRGAYNARALTGLLRAVGLIRRGSENFVPYVVAAYSGGLADMHEIADVFARHVDGDRTSVPVHYLGLWDTVKALGMLRRGVTWPYTRQLPNARRIRHAVSLDERRRPFREYPIDDPDDASREEAWFAGVHTDIGGTFDDDPRLSTIALKWVAEEAVAQGMLVRSKKYAAECRVDTDSAMGTIHRNAPLWRILGTRERPLLPGARVHASAGGRGGDGQRRSLAAGDSGHVIVDADWTTLRPPPARPRPRPDAEQPLPASVAVAERGRSVVT